MYCSFARHKEDGKGSMYLASGRLFLAAGPVTADAVS
jgi:hypothetical protein